MNRLQKVKTHLKENKKVYLVGGACLVIGALGGLAYSRNKKNIIAQINYKSPGALNVYIEALGDPGNIVQDTTTGIVYASQGQAAKELGLSAARISEQLAGKRGHVQGHVFEKLGKAMVPEVA